MEKLGLNDLMNFHSYLSNLPTRSAKMQEVLEAIEEQIHKSATTMKRYIQAE